MRRPALLVALLAVIAAAAVRRRGASRRDERDLWTEATSAPDLR